MRCFSVHEQETHRADAWQLSTLPGLSPHGSPAHRQAQLTFKTAVHAYSGWSKAVLSMPGDAGPARRQWPADPARMVGSLSALGVLCGGGRYFAENGGCGSGARFQPEASCVSSLELAPGTRDLALGNPAVRASRGVAWIDASLQKWSKGIGDGARLPNDQTHSLTNPPVRLLPLDPVLFVPARALLVLVVFRCFAAPGHACPGCQLVNGAQCVRD